MSCVKMFKCVDRFSALVHHLDPFSTVSLFFFKWTSSALMHHKVMDKSKLRITRMNKKTHTRSVILSERSTEARKKTTMHAQNTPFFYFGPPKKRLWNENAKRSHNARSRIGLIKWAVIVTTFGDILLCSLAMLCAWSAFVIRFH